MKTDIQVHQAENRTDAEIKSAALNALKWSSFVPEDCLQVRVENGWVTLEGEVEWSFQKDSASTALCDIRGIQGISNHIKVVPEYLAH